VPTNSRHPDPTIANSKDTVTCTTDCSGSILGDNFSPVIETGRLQNYTLHDLHLLL
jgi:hypothetical protein